MTYFNRYFKYRLRKVLFPTLIFTFLISMLLVVVLSTNLRSLDNRYYKNDDIYLDPMVYIIPWIVGIAAVVLPVSETQVFKKTRSLDFLLPMPASRANIALCHYLTGLLQLIFITAVPTVVHALMLSLSGLPFNTLYIFPMYIMTLYGGICIYTVGVFLFSKGNNLLDGIVSMFGFPVAIYTFFLTISLKVEAYPFLDDMPYIKLGREKFPLYACMDIFSLLGAPTSEYSYLIAGRANRVTAIGNSYTFLCILWGIFAIAALVGFIFHMRSYRAEKAGDISDSYFSYRLIIPVIALSFIIFGQIDIGIGFMLIFIGTVVGYFIYRRSFRLKPADIAVIAFMAVIGILGGAL